MISIVILTYNEERNIDRCIRSVSWSDDVVVIDSYSTDSTVRIATELGAKVVQNKFINFAQQRNFALGHVDLKHDWVLHIDADEVVPDEMLVELKGIVAHPLFNAYHVSSRMMFMGEWIRYSSLFPWYQMRFARRSFSTFKQVGHGQHSVLAAAEIGCIRSSLIHYSFSKGLHDWFEKHNRYSSVEALQFISEGNSKSDFRGVFSITDGVRRKWALKKLFRNLPFRPLIRFLYMYFYRLGFLDGWRGFNYCVMLTFYEFMISIKIREDEIRRRGADL